MDVKKIEMKMKNTSFFVKYIKVDDFRKWLIVSEINEIFFNVTNEELNKAMKEIPRCYKRTFLINNDKSKCIDSFLILDLARKLDATYDVIKLLTIHFSGAGNIFDDYRFDIFSDSTKIVVTAVNSGLKQVSDSVRDVDNAYQDLVHEAENNVDEMSIREKAKLADEICKIRKVRRKRKNALKRFELCSHFIRKGVYNHNSVNDLERQMNGIRESVKGKLYNKKTDRATIEDYIGG